MHAAKSWITLHVWPRHEGNVATLIEHKGYEFFFPTYKVRRKWSDRIKVLDLPLFPGYVFCQIANHGALGLVVSTPGVVRIISAGGKPCLVTEQEIDVLKKIVVSDQDVLPAPYLTIGQKVRVLDGPLTGLIGIITKVKNRTRLVLSIDAILRSVSVDVETSQVAPVAVPHRQ